MAAQSLGHLTGHLDEGNFSMLFLKTSAAKSDPEVTSLLINSTKVRLFFYVVVVGFSDFRIFNL